MDFKSVESNISLPDFSDSQVETTDQDDLGQLKLH